MKKLTLFFCLVLICSIAKSQQDTVLFYKAQKAHEENNNYEAIKLYTECIKLCTTNSGELREAYLFRGMAKFLNPINDFYGAIDDFKKVLSIKVETSKIYWIVDKEHITESEDKTAYLSLGDCYHYINDKATSCLYYSKAGELGDLDAYKRINEYCK